MAERENQRQRQLMRDAVAGLVDEEIEVAFYAMREHGFEDSWRKGPRWIKRRLKSGHPADDTGTFNIVVLTPTRVLLFNAKPGAPMMVVRRQIAEWPRGALDVHWKGHTAVAHYNSQSSMASTRVVRAIFTWDGEERPLVLDFPKGALTKELLEAVKATR
jgi:hypothetical protein